MLSLAWTEISRVDIAMNLQHSPAYSVPAIEKPRASHLAVQISFVKAAVPPVVEGLVVKVRPPTISLQVPKSQSASIFNINNTKRKVEIETLFLGK
jgi:hypothetical protein